MFDKQIFGEYKKDFSRYLQNSDRYENQEYIYHTLLALDDELSFANNKEIREYAMKVSTYTHEMSEYMASQVGDYRYRELYWKLLKLEAQNQIVDSYLLYLEKNRDFERRFYLPRRRQLRNFGITQGMQDLIDDKLDLLTVSMPPGSGKSTFGIFFLSGVMGWFPEEPNLASAHSGLLTRSFYDGVSQILNDADEYTWHEIFPDVKFSARGDLNSKEQTINVGNPKRFKSLTCRAINASLTGATRCERLLYADDLCSGIEEALSKERMDKLWQTYNTDLKTRKKKFCKEIHIQTRWSVHDVVGRLQRLNADNNRAKFIAVPALNENGESNFDYDYGVGFDTKYFVDMKNSMDDVSFKCLFMNEPIEREGLLYHDDDFERYYDLPEREPDAILGVCDTKDRGTDFEFLPLFYKYGDKYYFEDCVYDNGAVEVLDGMCENIIVKHNPHMVQFESNSAGGRTADAVNDRIKGKCRTRITKKFTTQNKETKIIVNSGWVKEHILLKDKSRYTSNSQYGKALAALFSYTVAGKNKNDDAPDGFAMFAEMVAKPEPKKTAVVDPMF